MVISIEPSSPRSLRPQALGCLPSCRMATYAFMSNADIGYPKLFIGGEESGAPLSPQPPVNNFVGTEWATRLEWHEGRMLRYGFARISRLGGSGLRTLSRSNDFHLYRPAHRAGLDLLTTTQRPCLYLKKDCSILTSPGQARGEPICKATPNPKG